MINELEQLLQAPTASFQINENQLNFMLTNLGNPDSHLRDDLIYTLFARAMAEDAFTPNQIKKIVQYFFTEQPLFSKITSPASDAIFERSFAALLGELLLTKDKSNHILTEQQRNTLFSWSITYLKNENDYRGYVKGKGWAHSLAHGSDFLGSSLAHPLFKSSNIASTAEIWSIIPTILTKITQPLVDDEPERIAHAFYLGVKNHVIATTDLKNKIAYLDHQMWQNNPLAEPVDFYRLSIWQQLLRNWYFFFADEPKLQQFLQNKINNYFNKMGYETNN
ncbi:DUF2785 domain-containing protein [Lactobacillus sp. ESL0681]|uniref:DUF2785 domain-containing protein n=1 Tax=Lactobacillus sp. ESL0681 TaxID=2983211 RepID=UPI0023F6FDDD|nr:DUF2785 domain-containing protein [Lactobacillus sp. ESL0681]WEV40882.1 DUF2785 domain-containing protein [Lactobacillus sp. ESL0681]